MSSARDVFDASCVASAQASHGYGAVANHSRKRKNAEDNLFETMLNSVPGMGSLRAKALCTVWPSASAMKLAGEKAVSEAKVNGRKVGPVMAKRLFQAL